MFWIASCTVWILNLPLNKLQYLVLSGVKVRPGIHEQKIHSAPFYLKKKILVRECRDMHVCYRQSLDHVTSVADPDPGSGAFLLPGSGIRIRFFPDPGSRIPNSYF
jgi:hypothetical protein